MGPWRCGVQRPTGDVPQPALRTGRATATLVWFLPETWVCPRPHWLRRIQPDPATRRAWSPWGILALAHPGPGRCNGRKRDVLAPPNASLPVLRPACPFENARVNSPEWRSKRVDTLGKIGRFTMARRTPNSHAAGPTATKTAMVGTEVTPGPWPCRIRSEIAVDRASPGHQSGNGAISCHTNATNSPDVMKRGPTRSLRPDLSQRQRIMRLPVAKTH